MLYSCLGFLELPLEEKEGFKPNDRADNASLNFTTQLRKGAVCCGLQVNYNFQYEKAII